MITSTGNLGTCTSVFGHRDALTAGKLASLVGMGIDWIEIAALQMQHLNLFNAERVDGLVEAAEALPMRVWSLHVPFCGLAMDDPETRADSVRTLRQAITVAHRFGARRVVVHPGRDVPCVDRSRELDWMVEGVTASVESLPEGMMLAVETMGPASLGGPAEEMMAMMDRLPAARVGVCLDTGHVNTGGDPAAYARRITGRIASVHLHDNLGDRDAHDIVGRGAIDWPACLAAIRDAGYTGPWMSEAGTPGANAAEAIGEFVRTMTPLVADLG
jgi:sugar phosphate isomerase/epimerase